MDRLKDILFICVNYGTDVETLRFVDEVLGLPSKGAVNIVVVDNSGVSDKNDLSAGLAAMGMAVRYMRPAGNLGYFGGAKWGLAEFLKHNAMPGWVIVSNVDLRFADTDLLVNLCSNRYDAKTAVIAPDIRSSFSEISQNPYMTKRPTRRRMLFYKLLNKNLFALNAYEALSLVKTNILGRLLLDAKGTVERGVRRIYAPHGSFIIFKRCYFEKGGDLEYPGFLFGEEIFVAESARAHGLDVVFDSTLKIIHVEHVSTGFFWSRNKAEHRAKSVEYCYEKFFRQ